jgi:hypothetical protein
MARRFVRSQRNGISSSEGKSAASTRGIVSPTMTQKAIMPPNALSKSQARQAAVLMTDSQHPLRQRNGDQARLAKTVFYRRLEGIGAAELGVDDNEPDGPVHRYSQTDKEHRACDKTCVAEGIRLADNACASAAVSSRTPLHTAV